MKRGLPAFHNSLVGQLLAVAFGALFGLFIFSIILMKTTAIFRIMPFAVYDTANPIAELVTLVERASDEAKPLVLSAFSGPMRTAHIHDKFSARAKPKQELKRKLIDSNTAAKDILSGREMRFRYIQFHHLINGTQDHGSNGLRAISAIEISVSLKNDKVLSVAFSPASLSTGRPTILLVILFIAALCISAVATMLILQAIKPLRRLEQAAQHFDGRSDPDPAPEIGANEVRRVACALNRMQDRVRTLVAERARMFSSVTHDIRTSITRVRLRLDAPDELDRDAILRDLDQMQALIDDILTYARSDNPAKHQELTDLTEFIRRYAEDDPNNIQPHNNPDPDKFVIAADTRAITRALNNLVDNACRYGGGAKLSYGVKENTFEVIVKDDGPGIPEEKLESVFEPFMRLEGSRSRETGGTGLGLGIARALVRANGGDVILENCTTGGLRTRILFPPSCCV
ncbi:MAG: ATP-binding protein [Pseudomonadota bacterium]